MVGKPEIIALEHTPSSPIGPRNGFAEIGTLQTVNSITLPPRGLLARNNFRVARDPPIILNSRLSGKHPHGSLDGRIGDLSSTDKRMREATAFDWRIYPPGNAPCNMNSIDVVLEYIV
jgi:hypothetical protein